MGNEVVVQVVRPREDLLHESDRLRLVDPLLLDNVVEELTALGILHDEVDVPFGLDDLRVFVDTSYSWMMCGCLSCSKIQISLLILSMSACSTIFSFSSILMATFSPVGLWMPILTLPKVPSPMVLPESQSWY